MDEIENIKNKIDLKDIKSSFIIKILFSYLTRKKKLDIIMYNKQLQKMLLIDTKDYKSQSGKYKIGGKNGKGSEYLIDTNILIFEGEYLKGKKNGIGKEYNKKGILEFEGEY